MNTVRVLIRIVQQTREAVEHSFAVASTFVGLELFGPAAGAESDPATSVCAA